MRFIARFAMRGPFHAAVAAAMALLASLSVGLFIVISGAVVALTTLRHGSREGLRVLVFATALVVAVRLALGGAALPMLVLSLVVWLPSWLMAINLTRTRQQAMPLLMVAVLVAAYAIAMRMAVGDVNAFWGERLDLLFDSVAARSGTRLSDAQIAFVAAQMHLWSLVGMFSVLAAVILLARWWQAVLFNPGGFGSEFRELELPGIALYVAALSAMVLLLKATGDTNPGIASDGFVIVVVLFAFQGLAVIHHRTRLRRLAGGWLVAMYVMLLLLPHVVGPLLATTGVADRLADFRGLRATRKAARPPHEAPESKGNAQDDDDDKT